MDGRRVAQGRDFGSDGKPRSEVVVLDEERARRLADELGIALRGPLGRGDALHPPAGAVPDVDPPAGGEPQAPLLLADDDAGRPEAVRERLHHVHAHRLGGAVGDGAEGGRAQAEVYGAETVPERPRAYARAVANAQEAHEAIRPAGERFRTPKQVERELSRDEHALYELIWKRTIASQMKDVGPDGQDPSATTPRARTPSSARPAR